MAFIKVVNNQGKVTKMSKSCYENSGKYNGYTIYEEKPVNQEIIASKNEQLEEEVNLSENIENTQISTEVKNETVEKEKSSKPIILHKSRPVKKPANH